MNNPVDILGCAVSLGIIFFILYAVFQMEILILGMVVAGFILFAKTLYFF